eukprot:1383521-Amphidinium_carterae.1
MVTSAFASANFLVKCVLGDRGCTFSTSTVRPQGEMAQKDSQAESSKGARRSDGAGVKARPKVKAHHA